MQVICHTCKKPIASRKDLVTAQYVFVVRPYHLKCYSERLKSFQTVFIKNYPINGPYGTAVAIISPVGAFLLGLFVAFISLRDPPPPFVIAIWVLIIVLGGGLPVLYRLYSWNRYEKHLPE